MAVSQGYTGKGTTFKIGTTAVAQLKTAQWGGQKINFEDISNLGSSPLGTSSVILKEQMPVTADAGTMDLAGIFLPADAGKVALDAAWESQALTAFTVLLPKGPGQTTAGNSYAFSGYIAENPLPDVQWDKILTFKVKIQLTTEVVLTPGS